MRVVTYKGFTLEIGELPGPRECYWKIMQGPPGQLQYLYSDQIHEVECGSWQDLEIIAKREVERIIKEWADQKEAKTSRA